MQTTLDKAAFSRELSEAMATRGITRTELARRMGTDRATVGRVLDPAETRVTLDTLARAAAVLDRTPVLALEPERPSVLLARHRNALREILESRGFTDVLVFGSVARGEDTPESDLDLAAGYPEGGGLFGIGAAVHELSEVLGRGVDVVDRAHISRESLRRAIERDGVPL